MLAGVAPTTAQTRSRTPAGSPPSGRLLGWLGPIGAAVLGGVLRIWQLGSPRDFVFDETFYAKDALSLLRFGVERATLPDADHRLLHDPSAPIFSDAPGYVVHPPVGKWLIALGEWGFGPDPFGWRIAAAVASVISIVLLGRVVLRLTGNALLGTLAAGLLALDGLAIVIGRTGLLDGFLAMFVLAAFAALLLDRDRTRARYLESGARRGLFAGWRLWRVAAGVLLGLACGVKWSGLWYLAAFLVLTFAWEARNRRAAGAQRPWLSVLRYDVLGACASVLAIAFVVYVATWTGWFLSDDGWGRHNADSGILPQPLQALWHYHQNMYSFHVGLHEEHPYKSSAWGWLLQTRPTAFYYDNTSVACGLAKCSSAVTALGNPLIWWSAAIALVHQCYRAVMVRDWRSSAVVVGVLAGWVPWLFYPERTIFAFYSVVFLPFLIAGLTMSLGQILGTGPIAPRQWRVLGVGAFLLGVVLVSWWFYPVWSGQVIPYDAWRLRMWWPTWV